MLRCVSILIVFLATLVPLLALVPSAGAAPTGERKAAPIDFSVLPSHVQLAPINVPIGNGYPTRTLVTVYLGPHDREKIGLLCRMSPRVNDTVLSVLSREPVPVRDRKLVVTDVGRRLLGPINAALGESLVKEVHVLPGAAGAQGGVVAKLPFGNAGGCKGINDMLERLERQRQQEAGKH